MDEEVKGPEAAIKGILGMDSANAEDHRHAHTHEIDSGVPVQSVDVWDQMGFALQPERAQWALSIVEGQGAEEGPGVFGLLTIATQNDAKRLWLTTEGFDNLIEFLTHAKAAVVEAQEKIKGKLEVVKPSLIIPGQPSMAGEVMPFPRPQP